MSATILDRHSPLVVGKGLWVVETESSAYIVDLDESLVSRRPVASGAADLRRDAEAVTLETVYQCQVGLPMVLLLFGVADSPDVWTTRTTTPVVAIRWQRRGSPRP